MRSPKQAPGPSESEVEELITEPRLGWLVGLSVKGQPLVDFAGKTAGVPLAARTSLALDESTLEQALRQRQPAVLLFENGNPALPLLVGLVQPVSETPLTDAVLEHTPANAPRDALVDGKRVLIEGRDEIVLRCGKATLTLRRDGQILLKGVNIRTEAEEVQRIKGGKVQIN